MGLLIVAGCAALVTSSSRPTSSELEPLPAAPSSEANSFVNPSPSNAAPVEPSAIPVAGRGLPLSFDGSPVLVGADATRAFSSSPDGSPVLVGGWLAAPAAVSCPAIRSGDPWPIPCFAIRLASTPTGDRPISLFLSAIAVRLPSVDDGHVRPVVLRVHTRDAACANVDRCGAIPAIEAVVWTGASIPIPKPTSTRPPTGISRGEAATKALAFASTQTSGALTVRSAIAGPYGLVAPAGADVEAERWVWAVLVGGPFGPPDCSAPQPASPCGIVADRELVVVDDRDGTFLMATAPAP